MDFHAGKPSYDGSRETEQLYELYASDFAKFNVFDILRRDRYCGGLVSDLPACQAGARNEFYRIIRGVIILIAAMWLSSILQLTMVNYLFKAVLTWGIVVIAIVFQPELRRILERVGKSKLSTLMIRNDAIPMEESVIREMVHACSEMSWSRTGALIVFERKENLSDIIRTGTVVNADVKDELIRNIFYEGAPLHDGAMIIRDGRIHAPAVCFRCLPT